MSEINKQLERAQAFEAAENFEKAAKTYLEIVNTVQDQQERLKLHNKAFFTSQKSGKKHIMFNCGKKYYEQLKIAKESRTIEGLIPTFLDISGRMKEELSEFTPETQLEIINWMQELYLLAGNENGAYELSQNAGDIYYSLGQNYLSSSHLIGKEEKYNRGVELFNQAVEAYQSVQLNKEALSKILTLKLEKINHFIDVNRSAEAIEDTANLMHYFNSQERENQPYSRKNLSLKIADLLAEKALQKVEKQTNLSKVLLKAAKAGFEEAEEINRIAPLVWEISLKIDQSNDIDLFREMSSQAFEAAVRYNDSTTRREIFDYLLQKGKSMSDNILKSRMLVVKKGTIEFNNNKGIHYLLHCIALATTVDNYDVHNEVADYLFEYAKIMSEKKLRKQAIAYYEYCARMWWDTPNNKIRTDEVIKELQLRSENYLTEGKLDEAAYHLISLVDLFTHFGELEKAGERAYSFAQILGQEGKITSEIEFLERANQNFVQIKAIDKLKGFLEYLIQRSDPLFSEKGKSIENLSQFLDLSEKTAAAISVEKHGEILEAISFKALNSDLTTLVSKYAPLTFEVYKSFNKELAADFYFKIGSSIIENDKNIALDYISKSSQLASSESSLEELVVRNLQYIMDQILSNPSLDEKRFVMSNFEKISSLVNKKEMFNAFLFPFSQHLSERNTESAFFEATNEYLMRSFTVYYEEDKNHPILQEIIDWTLGFVKNLENTDDLLKIVTTCMVFHERVKKPEQFQTFLSPIIEQLSNNNEYLQALSLYKQAIGFFTETGYNSKEFTDQTVKLFERDQKSLIHDEHFDQAWENIQSLFQILKDSKMDDGAIELYKNNSLLFAEHRLDLALTMWSKACDLAQEQQNPSEYIDSLISDMQEKVLPIYIEMENTPATIQLYNQIIKLYQNTSNDLRTTESIIELMKYLLTCGDYANLLKWGENGLETASKTKLDDQFFNITNMFFGVGRGLLNEKPETGIHFIQTASNSLRSYGSKGINHYSKKLSEIYEDLYKSDIGHEIAISERENLLAYFKSSDQKEDEAKFLVTSAKISFDEGNIVEGLSLISTATKIFQDFKNENGLSDIVSICLRTAAGYQIGSSEYNSLSSHATLIQEGGITISDEQTQEAFSDLYDGLLDDMTSLFDPKAKRMRQKQKKKK